MQNILISLINKSLNSNIKRVFMKKVLFLIPLLLFSMGSLFADETEKTVPEQLPIEELNLKLM